jgi:DNA polymerase III alpha subunit
MAILMLEDGVREHDAVVFGDDYIAWREHLIEGANLYVEASLQKDFQGKMRLRLTSCQALSTMLANTPAILKWTLQGPLLPSDIDAITTVLTPHVGGNTTVILSVEQPDAHYRLKLGDAWKIKLSSALILALEKFNHAKSVEVTRV